MFLLSSCLSLSFSLLGMLSLIHLILTSHKQLGQHSCQSTHTHPLAHFKLHDYFKTKLHAWLTVLTSKELYTMRCSRNSCSHAYFSLENQRNLAALSEDLSLGWGCRSETNIVTYSPSLCCLFRLFILLQSGVTVICVLPLGYMVDATWQELKENTTTRAERH